ncbi:MAG: hypothetical protein MI725_00120 [Pirellulales bacterium]|nr:hypothetical protein [Pirellulales bacterium]
MPSQHLEPPATVLDFLENGDFASAKEENRVLPTKPQGASTRTSPFQKWIAPKKSTAISEKTETATAKKSEEVALKINSRRGRVRAAPPSKSFVRESSPPQTEAAPATREPKVPIPEPKKAKGDASVIVEVSDLPQLTRSQRALRTKIRHVLTHYYKRPLNTRDRSPWEILHAMLAYEIHSKVLQEGPQGKPITAVGWLCFNRPCKRRSLMYVNDEGKLRVRVGPALQGHRGQLLAMLAQSKVSREYPMLVDKQDFTVADLIKMEMETCYPRTELTFKLIGLMHYLKSDATWVNDQGMEWNIPRLISEELRQPIRGAACGGTHRLAGLTLAYKTRQKRGEPVDGAYLKAQRFVRRYQQYAYRLQNPDGSFSTEWFRGEGNEESLDRKLKTTGHILEWLLYAATERELKHWRTTKAVNYLASILYNNRYKDWEAGPLGHAIHALLLYDRLVFQQHDLPKAQPPISKARRSSASRRQR